MFHFFGKSSNIGSICEFSRAALQMSLDSNLTCEHITGDRNLAGSILREAGFIYSDYRIGISLKKCNPMRERRASE